MTQFILSSIIVLAQANAQTQQSDLSLDAARELANGVVGSISLEDKADDAIDSLTHSRMTGGANTGRSQRLESDLVTVVFTKVDNSVFAILFDWPGEPFTTDSIAIDKGMSTASTCAKALLPGFSSYTVDLQSASSEEYAFLVTPMVGDAYTTEYINVRIRRADGLPVSIGRNSPRLNYDRYSSAKLISPEQALTVALDAYNRFKPFAAGQLVSVRRFLGSVSYNADIPHELRSDETALIKNGVALPYYWIMMSNTQSSRSAQHILVHAIDSRPLVVNESIGFGGTQINFKLPNSAFEAILVGSKIKIKIEPVTTAINKPHKDALVVLLQYKAKYFAVRIEQNKNLIWLKNGNNWKSYKSQSHDKLIKAASKPGSFGIKE